MSSTSMKELNENQRKALIGMIIAAVRNPYRFVIPAKSVVRQLCFRQKMIERLEQSKEDKRAEESGRRGD